MVRMWMKTFKLCFSINWGLCFGIGSMSPLRTSFCALLDTGPMIQGTKPWPLLAIAFVPRFLCGLAHSVTCWANISWWWRRIWIMQWNDLLFLVYSHVNDKLLAFTEHTLFCHVLFSMDFIQLISCGCSPYEVLLYICPFISEAAEIQIHGLAFSESHHDLGREPGFQLWPSGSRACT